MTRKQIITILSALLAILILVACLKLPTPEATGHTMYVCGYDRCRDSDAYGEMILESGINVWRRPDPDRGGVFRTASQGDKVIVTEERRVSDGPGGLWYRLADGGWIDDYFLTGVPCGPHNLDRNSFKNCSAGQY
jgi:hypothetical protein